MLLSHLSTKPEQAYLRVLSIKICILCAVRWAPLAVHLNLAVKNCDPCRRALETENRRCDNHCDRSS